MIFFFFSLLKKFTKYRMLISKSTLCLLFRCLSYLEGRLKLKQETSWQKMQLKIFSEKAFSMIFVLGFHSFLCEMFRFSFRLLLRNHSQIVLEDICISMEVFWMVVPSGRGDFWNMTSSCADLLHSQEDLNLAYYSNRRRRKNIRIFEITVMQLILLRHRAV